MKYLKFYLLLCLHVALQAGAQNNKNNDTLKQPVSIEGQLNALQQKEIDRQTENSVRWIQEYQKKERKKKQQKAILYLGLGIGFAALFVYGMSRKVKRKG